MVAQMNDFKRWDEQTGEWVDLDAPRCEPERDPAWDLNWDDYPPLQFFHLWPRWRQIAYYVFAATLFLFWYLFVDEPLRALTWRITQALF